MSDKPVKKTEYKYKCVFAGRRRLQNGKVGQLFIRTDNKRDLIFRGIKGVYLGFTYRCGADSIAYRPERADDERVNDPAWEAEDTMVDAENARKRADAKFKHESTPEINRAIEALRPLVLAASFFERKALVEYLVVKASKE